MEAFLALIIQLIQFGQNSFPGQLTRSFTGEQTCRFNGNRLILTGTGRVKKTALEIDDGLPTPVHHQPGVVRYRCNDGGFEVFLVQIAGEFSKISR
ncbi:hypothetical protein SDC9_164306 [bioreactor metagenome]|uniref:Uncharacterized protein n=1 Tax=bioreactor metagenome TaxID=1076179 RepID=A0A645FRA5_9ZZZZ